MCLYIYRHGQDIHDEPSLQNMLACMRVVSPQLTNYAGAKMLRYFYSVAPAEQSALRSIAADKIKKISISGRRS